MKDRHNWLDFSYVEPFSKGIYQIDIDRPTDQLKFHFHMRCIAMSLPNNLNKKVKFCVAHPEKFRMLILHAWLDTINGLL